MNNENLNYIYVPRLVPEELCLFLTHTLMRSSSYESYDFTRKFDPQIGDSLGCAGHELIFETLQEKLWTKIEELTGEELLPTYSYARLYKNGNELEKHMDRPACEVSVTIQLGRSHHYSWPIYMEGKRIDMGEGDAVIYLGCEMEHWRNVCDGPEDYYSGQVFIHFVRRNGPYSNEYGDSTKRKNIPSYVRNRTYLMESK